MSTARVREAGTVHDTGMDLVDEMGESRRARGPLFVLLVILVPALLFANVFLSFRHSQLVREIELLEREQAALIEANKEAILAISVLRSPRRIGALAQDELGLERIGPEQIERLRPGGAE